MATTTALTPRSSRQSRTVALDNECAKFLCVITTLSKSELSFSPREVAAILKCMSK